MPFPSIVLSAFLSGRARGKQVSRGMAGAKPGGGHGADLDRTAYGPAFGIVARMEGMGPGEGGIARFERVFCPAAFALAMAQDAVNDVGVGNKGDDAHAGAAGSASQRVSLENFPDQTGPGAAGLPGEIGIVPLAGGDAGIGVFGSRRLAQDSAPVGIGAVESLAVASRPASSLHSISRPDCARIFRTRDSRRSTGRVQPWRTIAGMVGDVRQLSLEPRAATSSRLPPSCNTGWAHRAWERRRRPAPRCHGPGSIER